MTKVADRPETSTHQHQEIPPFTMLLPHDPKAEIWNDLYLCHSVVCLARTALLDETDVKDSPSFASSVALEMVATKLMNAMKILDNLKYAK